LFCGEISPLGEKKKGGGGVIATCTNGFFLENPKNSPKVVMFSRKKKVEIARFRPWVLACQLRVSKDVYFSL